MTFDDWYFLNYPDLRPEGDDMYSQLERCWEAGYTQGYEQKANEPWENPYEL